MPLNRIAVAALAVVASGPSMAGTTINLFPNIGPTTVTDNGAYLPGFSETQTIRDYTANALGAMLDNELNRGGSILDTPTAFNTLPGNSVRYTDILATEFPSWRMNFNPTGAFANEQGTWFRVGLRVESDATFTLDHLSVSQEFPIGAPFEQNTRTIPELITLLYPEQGFAPTLAIGIYYGADGIRGTGDDIICDSLACDLATQPLNLFVWRGYGKFDAINNQELDDYFGGDKAALEDDERRFYSGIDPYVGYYPSPFTFRFDYKLTDSGGAVLAAKSFIGTVAGVPEPATWTQMILGVGLAGVSLRRRAAKGKQVGAGAASV